MSKKKNVEKNPTLAVSEQALQNAEHKEKNEVLSPVEENAEVSNIPPQEDVKNEDSASPVHVEQNVVHSPTGEESVEVVKKSRRTHGSGSIWESKGKYGICLQLGKTPDGKKLRHVQYYKSINDAEKALADYMADLDGLRAEKLEKLNK